jgi:hypothetical protein
LMRSASATEVPPNFMTTVWAIAVLVVASGMAPKDSLSGQCPISPASVGSEPSHSRCSSWRWCC